MHAMDWALYTPDEMSIFDACRKAHGENRKLIESPDHLFQLTQFKLFAGMLALVKYYGWVAYGYFDDGTTALVWKGDFLDLWAYEDAAFQSAQSAVARCGLHPTDKMLTSSHPHPK